MTTSAPAIEASAIVKSHGDVAVLRGIDLTVPTATVYALLGPNGAGKTTMGLHPDHPPVRRRGDRPGRRLRSRSGTTRATAATAPATFVRLVRIRTLAGAGVPLSRVQDLLDASPAELAEAVAGIDAGLRARIRELQEHRRRIAPVD